MRNKTRKVLELFVEKADILESRNFVKHVSSFGLHFNLSMKRGQPIQARSDVPDDEALAALMVTFRMFIQDNDSISLRNLSKLLDDPGLSENWKAQINDVRQGMNERLDRSHPIAIIVNGATPTAREILEVFVYGDIAHTNEKKREQFLAWKAEPLIFPAFQHVFHEIVMGLIDSIRYIAIMTQKELAGEEVPRLPTDEERAEMAAKRQAEQDAEALAWQNS